MNTLSQDERLILLEALGKLEPSYITGKLMGRLKESNFMILMKVGRTRKEKLMAEPLKPAIDLNKLRDGIDQLPAKVPPSQRLETYIPKRNGSGTNVPTALQGIAANINKLTWKEAEQMGAGIAAKSGDGTSLTAAIQAWADDAAGEQ